MNELKPCPFCGSTDLTNYGFIRCGGCGADGPWAAGQGEWTAEELWNKRQGAIYGGITERAPLVIDETEFEWMTGGEDH